MRIKIKDTWYDSKADYPIMVEFQDDEKEIVSNMPKHAMRYAILPRTWTQEEVDKWMDEGSLAETGLATGKRV